VSSSVDVAILGGAGHVGIPLALVLADEGFKTLIYDKNVYAVTQLGEGKLPYMEEGGEELLTKALKNKALMFSTEASSLKGCPNVIITVGTPVDEFHNPKISLLTRCLDEIFPHLDESQVLILRSTVPPGATRFCQNYLAQKGKNMSIAFCPERVVQGKGIEEIRSLPQLISGTDERAVATARKIFGKIGPEVIEVSTDEAEFGKLICNTYRYLEFAATNQLYMLVESYGLDYKKLLKAVKHNYPRLQRIPGPGLSAGPCLMKDTMQLSSLGKHRFPMGQLAVSINEGMPDYIIDRIARKFDLKGKKIGILGMAFKGDCDDIRDSLSYKLKKVLEYRGADVFCSDPFVQDEAFISSTELLKKAEIVIVGAPHSAYKTLKVPTNVHVADVWGVLPT
jgi:UDP-N-acetyl-D-mannosaminuronic acid dehydrogenase